jgi:NDP-sugar pyrophosphorylase family protein
MQNEMRYGAVQVGAGGRVTGFAEKPSCASFDFVNAGIYVFDRQIFQHIPEIGPFSLEKDIFPQLIRYGVYALEQNGVFIDIGTPEDYARAQGLCEDLYKAAYWKP